MYFLTNTETKKYIKQYKQFNYNLIINMKHI